MTATANSYELPLKVGKGAVEIVDVPEFGFVAVAGTGKPISRHPVEQAGGFA